MYRFTAIHVRTFPFATVSAMGNWAYVDAETVALPDDRRDTNQLADNVFKHHSPRDRIADMQWSNKPLHIFYSSPTLQHYSITHPLVDNPQTTS